MGRLAMAAAGFLAVYAAATSAQDAPGGTTSLAAPDEGREVYELICQACHMADAKGGGGAGAAIPALAGDANLADPKFMIGVVVKGRGGMPWFSDMLTPSQIAGVVNYVRTHFNDFEGQVSAADVEAFVNASGSPGAADCNTCK